MLFIGITGGVGAGKSAVLDYLASLPRTKVMLTDEIAHELMEPGTDCYKELVGAFPGADFYEADGHFDRKKLAAFIFTSADNRERLNAIVHPAVKRYVAEEARKARQAEMPSEAAGSGSLTKIPDDALQLLVVEAALLIEEHYDEVCDELWYIYTSEENRRARLKATRGYSDAKVDGIFASQLSEAEFRAHCSETIDNNGDIDATRTQLAEILLARGIRFRI